MGKPTKHFAEWFQAKGDRAFVEMKESDSDKTAFAELERVCWRAYQRGRSYGFREGVRRVRGNER